MPALTELVKAQQERIGAQLKDIAATQRIRYRAESPALTELVKAQQERIGAQLKDIAATQRIRYRAES
ncbi:hypothetical protein, partial [Micromonospora chokoriensis]